jgi:erythromycin esterase-like protein
METAVRGMLNTYPAGLDGVDTDALARCIEECVACAQACTACADACLSEGMVADLAKCIRTDLDCADICTTTAAVLSRHTGYDAQVTRAVLTACRACADECERHAATHAHCRICAEACRACADACATLLDRLG